MIDGVDRPTHFFFLRSDYGRLKKYVAQLAQSRQGSEWPASPMTSAGESAALEALSIPLRGPTSSFGDERISNTVPLSQDHSLYGSQRLSHPLVTIQEPPIALSAGVRFLADARSPLDLEAGDGADEVIGALFFPHVAVPLRLTLCHISAT